jgi:hypothetical protein
VQSEEELTGGKLMEKGAAQVSGKAPLQPGCSASSRNREPGTSLKVYVPILVLRPNSGDGTRRRERDRERGRCQEATDPNRAPPQSSAFACHHACGSPAGVTHVAKVGWQDIDPAQMQQYSVPHLCRG